MARTHESVVTDQYGARADAYVTSAVHASGEDLDQVEALARRMPSARALDWAAAAAMSHTGWPRTSPR